MYNIRYMYHCKYCNKNIKHQSNYSRHNKTKRHLKKVGEYKEQNVIKETIVIKEPIITSNENDKIKRLEDIILKQTEMINKLINKDNNTTINNITNTTTTNQTINNDNRSININVIGNEDFKGIMDEELSTHFINIKDIKQLVLDTYLKQVYINKEENRNILYNDASRNHCKVYKGNGTWEKDNINNIIDRRIGMSKQILPKMFREMDDYKECADVYNKVVNNVKDFVNNEKDSEEYNNVVKNHKKDISNIKINKDSTNIIHCECCDKSLKKRSWGKHLKSKGHLKKC